MSNGAVQSVARAFAVLETLATEPAGVSEVAERTDLPKSTVSRLLSTLLELGAVQQPESGSNYEIGPLLHQLAGGSDSGTDLVGLSRQSLVDLVNELGESAGLSVLHDLADVVYLDQVNSEHYIQIKDWTGEKLPFHCVSSGLAIMANELPETIDAALAQPLAHYTDNTVSDPVELRHRLKQVADSGVAWATEERTDDITSVAAPIFQGDKAIAAIHIHGPSYRFPGERCPTEIEEAVKQATDKITALLRQHD